MFTSFLYRMDGPHFVTLVSMVVLKWLNFSSTMGLKLTCLLKLVFHVNILLATLYFKFYTCRTEFAASPLMMASQEGHVDTCAVLIERGATVDYQNKVRLMYYRMLCSVYCE